jgi:hypothetical protein
MNEMPPEVDSRTQPKRPQHEIVDTTNRLLQWRETLTSEQQQRLDADHARATAQVLQHAQNQQYWATAVPSVLPVLIQSTWDRHVKSHDKVMKRMMTGTEAAVQDADQHEAAIKKTEAEAEAEAEAKIDNDLLAGLASDKDEDDNSNHSEVREVIFSTLISPPRATGIMLLPPRPTTPEVGRKRSFTLVHRTPEEPRAAPAAVTRETSPVPLTPQELVEIPLSTAPARLDGRERREGKNKRYTEAITIERGQGRGARRGGRGRGGKA